MKNWTIFYKDTKKGGLLDNAEIKANGLEAALELFKAIAPLTSILSIHSEDIDDILNEDFRVFHSSDTDYEPLTEEQKEWYWQAELEAVQHIQQQQIREAKGW